MSERNICGSRDSFGSLASSYYRKAAVNHFYRRSSEYIYINFKLPLLAKSACILGVVLAVGAIILLFLPQTRVVQATLAPPYSSASMPAYEASDTVLTVSDDVTGVIRDGQEIQVSYGGHLSKAYVYKAFSKEQPQNAQPSKLLLRRGPSFDSSYSTRVTVYLKTSLFQLLVRGQ